MQLRLDAAAGQVLLDHQGDLEGDGVVELAEVKAGELLDLFQPVDQRVAVDEQLARRLGHVQVILEELVDGEQCLLIQRVDGVLFEHLLQEHLAQGGGQLIDQAADAQILVVDDVALGVEHLAHLDGDLGFLVALGQITQMERQRADAHEHAALAVLAEGDLDAGGHGLHILGGGVLVHLVDQRHVMLAHAEDEVVLPVGEQRLHHVHGDAVQPVVHGTDDEHAAGDLGVHMQLLGAHVDVGNEDVVGDDILDEGALVVLLLVVALGGVQGNGGHGADGAAHAVVAGSEHGVVKAAAPAGQRLEILALQRNAGTIGGDDRLHILAPLLADSRQLTAGDDGTLGVDNADRAVSRLLELKYRVLKDPAGHNVILLRNPRRYFVQSAQLLLLLYRHNHDFASVFLSFTQKTCRVFCGYVK